MTTKEFINKILDLKILSSIDIDYAKNSMDLYLGNTPLLYIEYFRQYYFILEGNVLSKCPKEKGVFGGSILDDGDYILRTSNGDFVVRHKEDFEENYELIEG